MTETDREFKVEVDGVRVSTLGCREIDGQVKRRCNAAGGSTSKLGLRISAALGWDGGSSAALGKDGESSVAPGGMEEVGRLRAATGSNRGIQVGTEEVRVFQDRDRRSSSALGWEEGMSAISKA